MEGGSRVEPISKKQVFVCMTTTHSSPSKAQIAQLSYIIRETSSVAETIKGVNHYFSVAEISSDAARVNKITVSGQEQLSGGKTFASSFQSIYKDLQNAEIIAHNALVAISMLREEYNRNVAVFRPFASYCTMAAFKPVLNITAGAFVKNPSLTELVNFRGVSVADIHLRSSEFFRESDILPHDPRFDATALFLAYFAGPLPQIPSSSSVTVPLQKTFSFTVSAKNSVSLPPEKLTVTQFLKALYTQVPFPGDQQFLLNEVFDELKLKGALRSEGRKTVLSDRSASFGFEMEHREPGPGKAYDVIVANEQGKRFLLDQLFEMHQKRSRAIDALQNAKLT